MAGQTKNWQKPLFILLLLIFILIVLFRFAEFSQIMLLLKKTKFFWLAAAACFQLAAFAFLACLYHAILEKKVSFFYLLKTVVTMVFIEHALPSFSASSNAMLYYATRRKTKKDKASLVVGLNIFMDFFLYIILFIASLIYLLYIKEVIGKIWLLSFLIVIAFILLYRIIWTSAGQRHFKMFLSWLLKKWPGAREKTLKAISGFYDAKKTVNKKKFMQFFCYMLAVYFFRIATIAAVFFSLSYFINPGILVAGYIITLAVTLLSYIRIGIYEVSMTLLYSALGLPYNLALTATLLYRAISFWIPFLLGFLFFRALMKEKK